MDAITIGRALIADSLGFHILIASLSIGVPFVMNLVEFWAIKKDDEKLFSFARLLAKCVTILAVAGVISGTMIAFQFAALWAPFVETARPFVGKFFMLEGYAFMIEALFLWFYFYKANPKKPWQKWWMGVMVTLGASGSAFFITLVNAWMNDPSGIFTKTAFFEISHSITAYLLAGTLLALGFVSWRLVKHKAGGARTVTLFLVKRFAVVSLFLVGILAVLGHASMVHLAQAQPAKIAAIELLDKTGPNAPMRFGGSYDIQTGKSYGGIVIPNLLSILVGNDINHEVKGLDSIPNSEHPRLIVHALFDIKMLLVGLLSALLCIFIYFMVRKRHFPKWLLVSMAWFSGVGLLLIELGWLLVEFGRQPWAVHGKLLVRDAFTKNIESIHAGIIFPVLFIFLLIATVVSLRITLKNWRKKEHVSW